MTATPATTRKRARSQIATAGSLSLLSVPKLKIGDSVPSCPCLNSSQAATSHDYNQKLTGRQSPVPRASKQPARDAASSNHKGKENRLNTHTQPEQAKFMQLPRAGKVPGLTEKSSDSRHILPAEVGTGKMPTRVVTAKENLPAHFSTSASPSQLSLTMHDVNGTSHARISADGEATTRTAVLGQVLDKHSSGVCAGVIAATSEAEQALLVQDVPLACHTAINKRRCKCSPSLYVHDNLRKVSAVLVDYA